MIKIQVLGTGCANCEKLAENADAAARELGIEYELEKVKEIERIVSFGVMKTPALVVDGTVRIVGRVPSSEEIRQLLES